MGSPLLYCLQENTPLRLFMMIEAEVCTSQQKGVRVQYDGHIALVQGLDSIPPLLAPFDCGEVSKYEKGGVPFTVMGEEIYLHTELNTAEGIDYLIPTGLLARVLNKPYSGKDRTCITRNTLSITLDPDWVIDARLRDYQCRAVMTALRKRRCVISIPTGGGKSLVIEELCRTLRHVLVLVPTQLLLYQMAEQLKAYDVGLVGDGHLDIGKHITIAIPDTLYNKRDDCVIKAWLGSIPALIVDECHTISCPTGAVISSLMRGTQYRIGLSATPCMDNFLEGVIGAIGYVVREQVLIASGHILAPVIKVAKAPPILKSVPAYLHQWYAQSRGNFNPMLYQALYSHCILHNDSRNALIANLAKEYVESDNGPLIIVVARIEDTPPKIGKNGKETPGKVSHASILGPLLEARGLEYEKLSGTSPKKVKDSIVRRLGDGSVKLVIAGASILKDGVNIPQATGTIIAGAGRGGHEQSGLIQQAGRLLRTAEGKGQPTIYIIDDDCHTLFSNQSRALITACAKTYGKGSVVDYTYGTKNPLTPTL